MNIFYNIDVSVFIQPYGRFENSYFLRLKLLLQGTFFLYRHIFPKLTHDV